MVYSDHSVVINILRGYQHLIFIKIIIKGKVGRIRFKHYNIDKKNNELLAFFEIFIIK